METNTTAEWSGSPWGKDPANFWVDDATGEVVCAESGVRLSPAAQRLQPRTVRRRIDKIIALGGA